MTTAAADHDAAAAGAGPRDHHDAAASKITHRDTHRPARPSDGPFPSAPVT